MRAFVESGHSGDSVSRRSRTGFIVFLNIDHVFICSEK